MQGAKSEHRYDCPNSYFFRTLLGGAARQEVLLPP
jgi:hypothetical protein